MAEINGTRDALNQQNIINFKCLIKNKCKWQNEMAHYLFTDELNALIIAICNASFNFCYVCEILQLNALFILKYFREIGSFEAN